MPPPLRRIPLLPLAGLGIVLVAGIAAILLSRSAARANGWVNETMRLQVSATQLAERLAQQESAFRGYLLRGDPALRADFEADSARVRAKFAEIDRLTADETPEQTRIDRIGALVARRVAFMRSYIAERDRLGHSPDPGATLPAGRPLAMRIRLLLEENAAEEQRLLATREAWTQRLIDGLSIGLAGAVMLVVLVAYVTVGDARRRYGATIEAHREARTAALAARAEVRAREEAETQLRQIQRMESLGQLTGGIAHDFNNMLAVVIGSLDMARRRRDDPGRVQHHVESALEGAGRAAALVARLLAFARRQPLAPATIDPGTKVTAMADLLGRTLGEQIELRTESAADLWPIHADPGQLENAVLNLALNARDAMEGGGELVITVANSTLDESFVRDHPDVVPGEYVCIGVYDRGPGMSAEVRARAFDPFFTTKPVGKGTGLGLSQVFGFAKQSGGHATIDARDGGGLVVRLFLPRAAAAEVAAPAPADGAVAAGRGERILVVEDDDRVRAFSVEALRELGYAPVAAENGHAALELLRHGPEPDLLFTDVVMPGLGGPELVGIVRDARPALRVLFTTGYARDRQDGAGAPSLDPAIAVLAKPFTVAQLAQRVRQTLDA